MKKLVSLSICLLAVLATIACSNTGAKLNSNSPSSLGIRFYEDIKKGNYEATIDYVTVDKNVEASIKLLNNEAFELIGKDIRAGYIDAMEEYIAPMVKEFKSYRVISEEFNESGDRATVKMEITNNKGEIEEDNYTAILYEGKWYLLVNN